MDRVLEPILAPHRFSDADRTLIEKAYAMAYRAHDGQRRLSGEPYITHPLWIADYLAALGMDAATVAAALLHDTVEDTSVTSETIAKDIGAEVAFLVEGVTKLDSITYAGAGRSRKGADPQVESLKKMFFAMAEDIRVILLKLADRRHNMQTLQYQSPEARHRIAAETLEIYAPIAARLGMGRLKGELEDLAFPYAYPAEYAAFVKNIKGQYADRVKYADRTKPLIKHHLKAAGVPLIDIHSRIKHSYSLYRKLLKYDMDMAKVYDVVALRVIVPDIKACYAALGALHTFYKPLPGRIKDYIAVPKPNGYRSLHTTIFCEKGKIAEIQIRTPDMHEHAENGIAAHWAYAESGKKRGAKASQQEIQWVVQLTKFLQELTSKEGLKNLKIDFFKDRIFVFTPKGDVKDLPEGATPIDFAYAIHTGLGHAVQGALANSRIVPLDYELQSGDVVEIIKSKNAKPTPDWLRFVKTNEAKKRIRTWLNTHAFSETADKKELSVPAPKHKARRPIRGAGPREARTATVALQGQTGFLHKLGKCCSPALGNAICGYITRSKGITVHLASCKNIKSADERRIIPAEWQ